MKYRHCIFQLASLILSGLVLASCGSGGSSGGGTTPPVASSAQTVVSGTVMAPGGAIAFFKQPSIDGFFVSEAYAAVAGLAPVLDGTTVELGRVGLAVPYTFSVLATTPTSGGQYSFNLTALGVVPAVDLVVRVKSSSAEMRAFVTGSTVHLSPMSEVAFLKSTQQLSGNLLTQYTIQELADIAGSIALLANLQNLSFTAQNVAQALTSIASAVQNNTAITNLIAAAASPGQSAQGPGDIGNYFPFDQGIVWRYQGTVARDTASPIAFQNSVMISGNRVVNGVTTSVFFQSNPDNQGRTEEVYLSKDETGITQHEDSFASVKSVYFPLSPEVPVTLLDRKGLLLGQDLDGDGVIDVVDIKAETTIKAFDSINVPGGIFHNSARTEYLQINTYHSSAFGNTATITITRTEWLAPGVGFIKKLESTTSQGFVQDFTETITEELAEFIPSFRFVSLRVENLNGCGLLASGKGYCWGWNIDGQLGTALPYPQSWAPTPVAGNIVFSSINPGCGVATGGQAYCWGRNDYGQLGNGTFASSSFPVAVSGGLNFAAINSPGATTCGINTLGRAYCWGANFNGSFGNGTDTGSPIPVPVSGSLAFSTLSSSGDFVCGVTLAGSGYCWGDNQWGQLGNGGNADSNIPVPVLGSHTFSLIKIMNASACGLTTANDLYCWGINHNGEFGNGTTSSGSSIPVPAGGGLKFVTFDAGAGYYCGLTSTGAAYCWGFGLQGQLGNGTTGFSNVPVLVSGGHSFVSISAGLSVCGLTGEGAVYCWGSNDSGQLGNPSVYPGSSVPVRVFPPN